MPNNCLISSILAYLQRNQCGGLRKPLCSGQQTFLSLSAARFFPPLRLPFRRALLKLTTAQQKRLLTSDIECLRLIPLLGFEGSREHVPPSAVRHSRLPTADCQPHVWHARPFASSRTLHLKKSIALYFRFLFYYSVSAYVILELY